MDDLMSFLLRNQSLIIEDIIVFFPRKTIVGVGITERLKDGSFDWPITMMRVADRNLSEEYDDFVKQLFSRIADATPLNGYTRILFESDAPVVAFIVKHANQCAAILVAATTKHGDLREERIGMSSEYLVKKIKKYLELVDYDWEVELLDGCLF